MGQENIRNMKEIKNYSFKDQRFHHLEISQLICDKIDF